MPIVRRTIEELEDSLGLPIVLLTSIDLTTQRAVQFRLRDLPLSGIVVVVQWLNDRLSTPL